MGGTLSEVADIDTKEAEKLLAGVSLTAMCDIDNPLYGPTGAAYVFAPQKGADEATVVFLDGQLRALAGVIEAKLGPFGSRSARCRRGRRPGCWHGGVPGGTAAARH